MMVSDRDAPLPAIPLLSCTGLRSPFRLDPTVQDVHDSHSEARHLAQDLEPAESPKGLAYSDLFEGTAVLTFSRDSPRDNRELYTGPEPASFGVHFPVNFDCFAQASIWVKPLIQKGVILQYVTVLT